MYLKKFQYILKFNTITHIDFLIVGTFALIIRGGFKYDPEFYSQNQI
jgi:hypothetical protein